MPGFMAWLLRSSGEAGALILLVLLVQALLGGRLRPRWRYRLWWLVLLRLVSSAPQSPTREWHI
ncbi:MAG: hypothetical protein AB9869_31965 [Verrucomicrobiia bacterium]